MTPLRPARRRAERFADLVDGSVDGSVGSADARTSGAATGDLTELLELVGALRAVPPAQPRAEFVTDLRAQLMAAAEAQPAPAPERTAGARSRSLDDRLTVTPRHRPRERRFAVAVGAFAIVGATTSMAVASQSALPGDALYPLKRAIEDTHTSLSIGDESKGSTLLAHASDRLQEARALSQKGADADEVTSTLHAFTDQSTHGSDLLIQDYKDHSDTRSINELRDFNASSVAELSQLDGVVPPAAQSALVDAAKQLFLTDATAGQLCPACTSSGITDMPPNLLASGPLSQLGQLGGSLTQPTPTTGPSGGPQTLPSDTVSIPPSLLPTSLPSLGGTASAAPSSAPSGSASPSGLLGGVLGGLTGDDGDGKGDGSPKATPSLPVTPSAIVSDATAAVSDLATAVGGVVSDAASGVGTLLGGTVGGLTGTGQNGP